MKKVTRLVCLLLAFMLVGSLFAGCGKDEAESPTDVSSVASTPTTSQPTLQKQEDVIADITAEPYEIKQSADGKDIIIPTFDENKNTVLTVAEKTTLAQFLACVMPKEGHSVKVFDAAGVEVTDVNTEMVSGMVFNVFKDGEEAAVVTLKIDVVAQSVIDDTIRDQEDIDDNNDAYDQIVGGDDPITTGPVATGPKVEVALTSVWGSSYIGTSQSAKTWQASLQNIEKYKGYKTTVATIDANSATDLIVKEVMAGKASADVFEISLNMCRQVAKAKAAANWLDSKTLDFSKVQNGGTQAITFTDKCYGIALNGTAGVVAGIMYNKDLIKKYAPDYDLQKLYKEKKWDFNAFREVAKLCTQDTNGDGKLDVFGVTSNTNIIGIMLTSNAGGTALMNSSGRVEATMCNDAGVAALEFCKTLFKTDRSWKYYADIKTAVSNFCTGNYAMLATNLYFYSEVAPNATFKFDFVHAPMGPDYGKYVDAVYDASVYMVPKTKSNRLDELGTWMNHLTSVSGKLLNNEANQMAKNGFSKEAIDIFRWCKNNMQADFSTGAFSGNISGQVDGSVTQASKSPTKVMASIKGAAQKELDDFYANMY